MEILSYKTTAGIVVKNITNSIKSLEKNFNVDTDNKTTVVGNKIAQQKCDDEKQIIKTFIEVFKKDISKIHSASNEFETLDIKLQETFLKTND